MHTNSRLRWAHSHPTRDAAAYGVRVTIFADRVRRRAGARRRAGGGTRRRMPSCTASRAAVSWSPPRWPGCSTCRSRSPWFASSVPPSHEEYAVGAIADGVQDRAPGRRAKGRHHARAARVRRGYRARRARAAEEAVRGIRAARRRPNRHRGRRRRCDGGNGDGGVSGTSCAGRCPDRPRGAGRAGRVEARRGDGRSIRLPPSDARLLGGRPVLHRLHADDATRRSRDCCRANLPAEE